jgi:hypothetical protein
MPSCSTWRRHFTGASHKTLRLVQVMKELPDVYAPPHIDLNSRALFSANRDSIWTALEQ